MTVSKQIGNYIRSKGYNLSEVSRLTGLNYQALYDSLYSTRDRELRANEVVTLADFLDIDIRMFAKGLKEGVGTPTPRDQD